MSVYRNHIGDVSYCLSSVHLSRSGTVRVKKNWTEVTVLVKLVTVM